MDAFCDSVNLVRPLNLSNRATILSSVHLSCRSPFMLRGSAIFAPVNFWQSAGCVCSFDIFVFCFLPLMFLYLFLYLSLHLFSIYVYRSLSIFTSTIRPSRKIFTDLRFTSVVSGHTFVIRNRSRVATSLTWLQPYPSNFTSNIFINRYDSL